MGAHNGGRGCCSQLIGRHDDTDTKFPRDGRETSPGGSILPCCPCRRSRPELLDGDIETALGQLRDVVNATMGFDSLSRETGIPKTSLMRMLSDRGNPRAGNLATILKAIGQNVGVRISVHVEPANELEDRAV